MNWSLRSILQKVSCPQAPLAQGTRSKELLDWIEGSSGPGLAAADEILQVLIPKATNTAPQPLAFVISGKISPSTADELQAFVELLRKKTGDDSIDIAFFREGSIKVILNGSPEGLAKLQAMFEAGELDHLAIPPVEAVTSIAGSSSDARRSRLIHLIKLSYRRGNSDIARDIARDTARALMSDLATARSLAHTLIGSLTTALVLVRARDHIGNFDRDLTLDLERARALALDLSLDLDRGRDLDIDLALDRLNAIYRGLYRDHANAPTRDLDLSGADLRGVNLRNINLRKVDLTGADLTYADVTGTIFSDNPGLTEADKRDLQSRGAIIQDPPSSDVPSLVLR